MNNTSAHVASRFLRRAAPLLLGALLNACGNGDGPSDATPDPHSVSYAKGAVSGKVNGKSWTFGSGRAVPNSFGDGAATLHRIELISSVVSDVCATSNFIGTDQRTLAFTSELEEGELYLSSARSVAFVDVEGDDATAFSGKFEFTYITNSAATGSLYAFADDENSVNGAFSITRCCATGSGTFTACGS